MRTHARPRGRYGVFWIVLCIVICFAALIFLGYRVISSSKNNALWDSVVIVGDPVVIWSVHPKSSRQILLTIPADVTIDGAYDYGTYRLEALWKLGLLEKRKGRVLTESLTHEFGVSVPWYVEASASAGTHDPIASIFTLAALPRLFFGAHHTNMTLGEFFTFWLASWDNADNMTRIDLDQSIVNDTLPDGSTIRRVDMGRVDTLLGSAYELPEVRKEGLSIAVLNTTKYPNVGSKVAKLLSHLGMFVGHVGNDDTPIARCEIAGAQEKLTTITAKYIQSLYDCVLIPRETTDRSDLFVRIGTNTVGKDH